MNHTTTDELDRLDEAFAGNRLLSTFPAEARALIEPFGEIVELQLGSTILARGADVESTLFPFGTAMISLVVDVSGGRSIVRAQWLLGGDSPTRRQSVMKARSAGSSAAVTRPPFRGPKCSFPAAPSVSE